MLGQNLQNVVGQIMDFYLAKTYKKVLPKTTELAFVFYSYVVKTSKFDFFGVFWYNNYIN